MPAERLATNPVAIKRYDVAGIDSDNKPTFVRHVGLSENERDDLSLQDARLSLVHMKPPLEQGAERYLVHSIGTTGLTADELQQVRLFVEELESEFEAEHVRDSLRQYLIYPHVYEPNENCSFRRFNCAGFVIEAYAYAGIDLLVIDQQLVPNVEIEVLIDAYPSFEERLRNKKRRSKFGLEGDGPWPVVLAGYVMNSLKRSTEEIRKSPYQPVAGDGFF